MNAKKQKPRMGRPPLGPHAKTKILQVRVTEADLRSLKADAKKRGFPHAGAMLIRLWRESRGD